MPHLIPSDATAGSHARVHVCKSVILAPVPLTSDRRSYGCHSPSAAVLLFYDVFRYAIAREVAMTRRALMSLGIFIAVAAAFVPAAAQTPAGAAKPKPAAAAKPSKTPWGHP